MKKFVIGVVILLSWVLTTLACGLLSSNISTPTPNTPTVPPTKTPTLETTAIPLYFPLDQLAESKVIMVV